LLAAHALGAPAWFAGVADQQWAASKLCQALGETLVLLLLLGAGRLDQGDNWQWAANKLSQALGEILALLLLLVAGGLCPR
jgi:hypothetical protein